MQYGPLPERGAESRVRATTFFSSPQDFFERRSKSAGVFEAKQKASHAKESLKLLDIEYWSEILLHIVLVGRAGVEPARTLLSSGF